MTFLDIPGQQDLHSEKPADPAGSAGELRQMSELFNDRLSTRAPVSVFA